MGSREMQNPLHDKDIPQDTAFTQQSTKRGLTEETSSQPAPLPEMQVTRAYGDIGESEPSPGAQIPRQLGDYLILKEIGRGGFGVVYLAEDVRLHRRVAVKVLAPHLAEQKEYADRFKREAKSVAALKHANVVTVHSCGEENGVPYLAMDYIHGETARTLLSSGTIDEQRAVEIVMEVAKGLDYAHQHGIIHRDLKPANIMVEKETNRVVIMDFGLARPEKPGDTLTETRVLLGTPVYMSPEQAKRTSGKLDRRTDLYSLGIVLYELVTGKVPFLGETTYDVLEKVVQQIPIPPSRLKRNLSKDLEAVILKAIEKAREDRYQTAKEFLEDLERYVAGKTVSARKRTVIGEGHRWVRRNRVFLTMSISAALSGLFISVTAYYLAKATHPEWFSEPMIMMKSRPDSQVPLSESNMSSLTGQVLLPDGTPASGAIVRIHDWSIAVASDDGRFAFSSVAPGKFTLGGEYSGCQSEQDFQVQPGRTTDMVVKLQSARTAHIRWSYQAIEGERSLETGQVVSGEAILSGECHFSLRRQHDLKTPGSDFVLREMNGSLDLWVVDESGHNGMFRSKMDFDEIHEVPPDSEFQILQGEPLAKGDVFVVSCYQGEHYAKMEILSVDAPFGTR